MKISCIYTLHILNVVDVPVILLIVQIRLGFYIVGVL